MRSLLPLLTMTLALASLLAGADNSVTAAEAQDGWILLFDGQSTFGWKTEGAGKWKVAGGILSFDGSGAGMLRTLAAFSDYDLKLDFRAPTDADAAVFLRYFTDGTPQETGYELRLGDSDAKNPAGSVEKVFSGPGKLAPNQWHTLEAEFDGDKIAVKIDGRAAGEGTDARSKAGYIGLSGAKGTLDFRNIKLKPVSLRALFNGSDLSGWKSVGTQPPKPNGLMKKLDKVFKPGEGKPKEADWSVVGGAIHGTKGPGQLESKDAYDDFVLQLDVRVNSKSKGHHPKSAIFLRGDAGKIETGYEVAIENEVSTGDIAGLKKARSPMGKDNEFFTETIAAGNRHFEIWIDGYPVNDYTDTRTEGPSIKKEARVSAGPVSLFAPESDSNLDFRNIKIAALPKALGGKAKPPAPAPAPKIPTTTQVQAPAVPAMPGIPAVATPPAPVIITNPNQAKDDARQAQVSKLTQQALKSNDPQEQSQLYGEILSLDPNNVVAAQGYRDAQQKIETAKEQQQKQADDKARQTQEDQQKAETLGGALKTGEAAFLAGDLAAAQAQVAIGKKIAPGDPQLQNLDARVSAAVQARQRIKLLAAGGSIVVLLGAMALLFLAMGKKEPYLEIMEGLDQGKRFALDQEVVHLGAIEKDGDAKNEIVLRDAERMISRFHCEIHRRDSKLYLVDANSANGTYLDGHRVPPERPMRLKRGSQLGLAGTCTLRVGFEKKKKA